jgi:hypothetical protein
VGIEMILIFRELPDEAIKQEWLVVFLSTLVKIDKFLRALMLYAGKKVVDVNQNLRVDKPFISHEVRRESVATSRSCQSRF